MQPTETRYAKNAEGHRIAYRTLGEGPRDLILLLNLTCVDVLTEDPVFERIIGRLARIGRVIMFDWRGQGASDQVPLGALPTIEEWSDDARVVLDAVGSTSSTLIGQSVGGGPIAMFLAATYPERTDGLVLINAAARRLRGEDFPFGAGEDEMLTWLDSAVDVWGTGRTMGGQTPSRVARDEEFARWLARLERLGESPLTWRAQCEWSLRLDVRAMLPDIRVPTLVIQSGESPTFPEAAGRLLAEDIGGARLAVVPGSDLTLLGEAADQFVDYIEEFVTGAPPVRDIDRALATVLFTDIVGSTDHATRLGDKRWTEILDRHDSLVIRELDRHRGRKVNPTGDGIVATFDGPARAVRCAQAICEAMGPLGIEVRAGLHTGEIELREDDIGGIAVHIGQRVSALAGAGEVLVSRTVTDLVTGSGLEFEERGEHELKGVSGRWQLYAVRAS
jgi:class 3 adenylate cyclase